MKPLPFFITCPKGLVELLEEEISGLGATVTRRSPAGIWIEAHWRTAMAICLWSRLGSRVIRHLGRFDAAYAEDLKRAAASLSWEDWLVPGTSFRVSFQGTDDNIRNSHFGAQCIKDGVLDRMSATGADRPSVEGKDPDLPIHARLHRGKLELGMDLAERACIAVVTERMRERHLCGKTWRRRCSIGRDGRRLPPTTRTLSIHSAAPERC